MGVFAENGIDGLGAVGLILLLQQRFAVERLAKFLPLGRIKRADGRYDGLNGSHS